MLPYGGIPLEYPESLQNAIKHRPTYIIRTDTDVGLDGDENWHRSRVDMPKYCWIATYVNEASEGTEENYNARLLHWPSGVQMPPYPHVSRHPDFCVVLEIVTPLKKGMEVLCPYHWNKQRYALLDYRPKDFNPEVIRGWRKAWDPPDLDTATSNTPVRDIGTYKRKYTDEELYEVKRADAAKKRRLHGRFI